MEPKPRQIADEMVILIRQLIMNGNQIRIALRVLEVYFIRKWKLSEVVARFLARKYLEKYYDEHVRKFRSQITN